jgi:hypothetical protein
MKRRGTKGLGVGLSVCHFYHLEVVVGVLALETMENNGI